ncbi:hypothetical protein MVES_003039 [Malassezia vespertilionis]|uniref:WIBG Mago-binding domain-containing protein n=1 Tax=Malassezia vespertilionis TaxID=2020962 RepID=A0A2N1JA12_9BASI|nr:hypothetical protein MVES_003039 [Malassezia vespertilionis]
MPTSPPATPSGIVREGKAQVVPQSVRADGSVRKERRVRPGFTPAEDIARFRPSRRAPREGSARGGRALADIVRANEESDAAPAKALLPDSAVHKERGPTKSAAAQATPRKARCDAAPRAHESATSPPDVAALEAALGDMSVTAKDGK